MNNEDWDKQQLFHPASILRGEGYRKAIHKYYKTLVTKYLIVNADWSEIQETVTAAYKLLEAVAKAILLDISGTDHGLREFKPLLDRVHNELNVKEKDAKKELSIRGKSIKKGEVLNHDISEKFEKALFNLKDARNASTHGTPKPPEIEFGHAVRARDTAIMWSTWALTLYEIQETTQAKLYNALMSDLKTVKLAKAGSLTEQLEKINLRDLEESEQTELGLLIGNRSAEGVEAIRTEGMRAFPRISFPSKYVQALVKGAFFDQKKNVCIFAPAILTALELLSDMRSPSILKVLNEIVAATKAKDVTIYKLSASKIPKTPANADKKAFRYQGLTGLDKVIAAFPEHRDTDQKVKKELKDLCDELAETIKGIKVQ